MLDITRRDSWIAAGKQGAKGHFLSDVMDLPDESLQIWTFERPRYFFDVQSRSNLRFRLDVHVPDKIFNSIGPFRMMVWIGEKQLGQQTLASAGDHRFEHPVPPDWIPPAGLTIVETTLDKYYVAPEDGQKLGYMFVRGGFLNGS